jgi:hypothetical protein
MSQKTFHQQNITMKDGARNQANYLALSCKLAVRILKLFAYFRALAHAQRTQNSSDLNLKRPRRWRMAQE